MAQQAAEPIFELLEDRHLTQAFDCGEPSLNIWLSNHALTNQSRDLSRTYVAVDSRDGRVVGYVALVTAQILLEELPRSQARGVAGLDAIGAVLIARLAVDRLLQRRGLGAWLLLRALRLCVEVADRVAVRAVIVDPLNKSAMDWYARYGFVPLPDREDNRMWLPIKRIRASL
ncbi:MAG: GNAT family N-acetyltransferase [Egibacteraceae bacterium]